MNKRIIALSPAALMLCLSGCSAGFGIRTVYGIAALLAAVILGVYIFADKKKNGWFFLLFCSIFVVNTGYYLLSVSQSLSLALWANRLAYLGSAFLPLSILMIILNAAKIRYKKWLPVALLCLAGAIFLLAATPGWLPLYYKEVSLQVIGGVSSLNKVYGPLHCLYLFYLLSYLCAMLAAIIYVNVKKKLPTSAHTVALTVATVLNMGVWGIEQLVDLDFEMLSLSYVISAAFLLIFDFMQQENERLKEQISSQPPAPPAKPAPAVNASVVSKEQLQLFQDGIATLTQTETLIFNCYTQGKSTKEVLVQMNITENTLKFHNKNIYSKLGINSRKQLLELNRQLNDRV